MIVTDGAAIYSRPDFDSQVQDYLSYQSPVVVSKRPYAGVGGLGLFHRVRYGAKMGFITDTDIRVVRKESGDKPGVPEDRGKPQSKAWEPEEDENLGKTPIYLSRYIGGALAMVNFAEKYSGRKFSDGLTMYGLRATGPDILFEGPPLDFNFWFSLQKPKYIRKFASGNPTGFLVFGDVMALLPLVEMGKTIVNYGLGVMLTYTKFTIPVKNKNGQTASFDSQEIRAGVDVGLGVAHRLDKILLRADAKYYFEKTSYPGFVISVQGEY